MSNLNDLKKIGEDLVPIFKNLFELIKNNANKDDKSQESAVIKLLKKFVSEAKSETLTNDKEKRKAIIAMNKALTELMINAASSTHPLSKTTAMDIDDQSTTLRDALGLIGESEVFENIPTLLPDNEIQEISKTLEGADKEIAQRQMAKDILDTVINVAIAAANIAAKVAV